MTDAGIRVGSRPNLKADTRVLWSLRRAWASADAVHAHGLRAGALAALARPRASTGVPLVVTLHNRPVGGFVTRRIGEVLMRIVARGADVVLGVSPDLVKWARTAGARKVAAAVIPAPVRTENGSIPDPSVLRHHDGLRVLVIARLAPQKGLDTLCDVVAEAVTRGLDLHVWVAGDGPLRDQLQADISSRGLPITLLGRRSDVPELMDASDVVLSTALWEGQPLSIQEALRAGSAIIATDAGGTRWVTGPAAILVPVGDTQAIVDALLTMRDPQVRREWAQKSQRRSAELPTDSDLVEQLETVLGVSREAHGPFVS